MVDTSDNGVLHEEEGTIKHISEPVEDDVEEPKIGMTFDTVDASYKYYNDYARRVGFSVRKMRTNKNKYNPNIFDSQTLCCSCEGEYVKRRSPKKRRENRRTGCKAEFHVNFINGKFKLTRFTAEHNHDLVPPDQAHFLRSHRKDMNSPSRLATKKRPAKSRQSKVQSFEEQISCSDLLATARYGELSQISQRIVAKGAKSPTRCSLTKKMLLDIEAKLDTISNSDEEWGNTSGGAASVICEDVNKDIPLEEPNSKRCRGQHEGRKKPVLEIRAQKNNDTSLQTGERAQGNAATKTMGGGSSISPTTIDLYGEVRLVS